MAMQSSCEIKLRCPGHQIKQCEIHLAFPCRSWIILNLSYHLRDLTALLFHVMLLCCRPQFTFTDFSRKANRESLAARHTPNLMTQQQ